MRMHQSIGWCHLTIPKILWLNTLVLIAASVAMQLASSAVGRGQRQMTKYALIAAGTLSIGFLAGQDDGLAGGRSLALLHPGQPAVAFFYVLTIAHWPAPDRRAVACSGGRRCARRRRPKPIDLRQSLALCAIYWHFLLIVWLVVFGVLLFL